MLPMFFSMPIMGASNEVILEAPTTNLWAHWEATEAYTETSGTPSTLITSDGTAIGSLLDKSGNGRHLYQSTAAAKPTYKTSIFNSTYPAIRNAAGDYMALTSGGNPGGTNLSVYAVINRTSEAGLRALLGDAAGTPNYMIWDGNPAGTNQVRAYRKNAQGSTDTNLTNSADHLLAVVFAGTSSTIRVDDNSNSTGTTGAGGGTSDLYLGKYDGQSSWIGDIAEMLIYDTNHTVTSGDGLLVRQYLDQKYALSLGI